MDPITLTIVITPELDKAISDLARDQMMTKEDIALCILAGHMTKVKGQKGGYLGFSPNVVATFIMRITSAISEAVATGKKEGAAEEG